MNREIKFRCFHEKLERMIYIEYAQYQGDCGFDWADENGKLWELDFDGCMQYIGLKDCKKKYIYESDIFFTHLDGRLHNIEIIFLHGCFGWKDPTCKNKFVDMHTTMQVFSTVNDGRKIEIIGNKFENPELLENK